MQIDAISSAIGADSPIREVQTGQGAALPIPGAEGVQTDGKSFGQLLETAISGVNDAQNHAADVTAQFAAGGKMDVHQVMIAQQEASLALNMATQVRNKLSDAYTEIMRMSA